MRRRFIATVVVALVLTAGIARAAPLPKLPTGFAGARGLQVRPAQVIFSGDGSAVLGGFTGRRTASRANTHWGHLHWTLWLSRRASATGAAWIDNGIPDVAHGTYHAYTAAAVAFRPRDGVFTRLRIVYIAPGYGPTFIHTYKAAHYPRTAYGPAYWDWLG